MTMRKLILIAVLNCYSSVSTATDLHPATFSDEGACPFECCTYREWSVKADTLLLEKPFGEAKVIGKVLAGDKVQGLTGTVIVTKPGEIEVLRPVSEETKRTYQVGDTVWVYTPIGEGFFKVWYQGQMYDEEAVFMYHNMDGWAGCVDDGICWGNRISFPQIVWWVKVKTSAGVVGWTKDNQNFGNMDACG